jgi:hypothetical protein
MSLCLPNLPCACISWNSWTILSSVLNVNKFSIITPLTQIALNLGTMDTSTPQVFPNLFSFLEFFTTFLTIMEFRNVSSPFPYRPRSIYSRIERHYNSSLCRPHLRFALSSALGERDGFHG